MKNKTCTDCKKDFSVLENESLLYEKVGISEPKKCFYCLAKQHFAFWPFGKFRKGVSDLSGKSLITVLPESPRYPIYTREEWWSDAWDAMDFGMDYDGSRPFFEQLKELQEKVPRPHQIGELSTDCDWTDDVWESKNCYLSRSIAKCENLIYGNRVFDSKNSIDAFLSFNIDQSYDCSSCYNSYNLKVAELCKDCVDSWFLFDCRNCTNCFMCWNLRGKSYCIENIQYTKEDYFKELEKYNTGSHEELEKLRTIFLQHIKEDVLHKQNYNLKCTNSTGNYLTNCKNCVNMYAWQESEDCYNSIRGLKTKDCISQTGTWMDELSGNNSCVEGGYQIKYSTWSNARYSEYLDLCKEIEYCFGCVGLRKKKYCILNKQYTKEEYEILLEKIISDMKARGEYGEYLPYNMAFNPYNYTTGILYLPKTTKEDILSHGGYWDDTDYGSTDGIPSNKLPDDIKDTTSDITKQALLCEKTSYRYNINIDEFNFYKQKNIALPRTHFDVRTKEKITKSALIYPHKGQCFICTEDITHYYPTEFNYKKIACEKCYQQEVN